MKPDAQDRLTTNIAGAMKDVSDDIRKVQIDSAGLLATLANLARGWAG